MKSAGRYRHGPSYSSRLEQASGEESKGATVVGDMEGHPANIDELLKSLLSSADLLSSLESLGVAPPKPQEVEKALLAAIDQRIDACMALKASIRAGDPQEKLRAWRWQAKTDQISEKCLQVYRNLYGTALKRASKEE